LDDDAPLSFSFYLTQAAILPGNDRGLSDCPYIATMPEVMQQMSATPVSGLPLLH